MLTLHALAILFFGLAIASILRTVYLQREVSADLALWPAVAAHFVLGVWCLACLSGKTPARG